MKRIVFLDILRIFSFTSVLVGHKFYFILVGISNNDTIHESLRFLIKVILPFCYAGGAGVVVFFLVSGYVITHVLQTERPFEFLIKRIFRIYPLYIFSVLLQYLFIVFIDHNPINFHILIPQLLLLGDFFHTPHSLAGVEWTLRIEILFYFFMLFVRYFKLLDEYKSIFPSMLVILTLIMGSMPLFPGKDFWNYGYLNINAPFLFLGVFIWLYEYQRITLAFLCCYTTLVFMQHWHLVAIVVPFLLHTHYAGLAFLLFFTTWSLRKQLTVHVNGPILFLSELTYSMYLLHNWLFDYIKAWNIAGGVFHRNRYALILLFTLSFLSFRLIEKPGIKAGRMLIQTLERNDKHSLALITRGLSFLKRFITRFSYKLD